MPERIKPSSPEFAEMDAWMYLLNFLKNPFMFFDGKRMTKHLPDLEREVYEQDLLNNIQRIIDE